MAEDWCSMLRTFRLRHGLIQLELAQMVGVSQRTISRWERGEDQPTKTKQKRLRDLGLQPPTFLMANLAAAVAHCPAPRALSRMPNLKLISLSKPALVKRPSMADRVGTNLIELASGVLEEMRDDAVLQRGIQNRDISCVVCTTGSVLRTNESADIGRHKTTITYFCHDDTLYSDAISFPADSDAPCGYEAIPAN